MDGPLGIVHKLRFQGGGKNHQFSATIFFIMATIFGGGQPAAGGKKYGGEVKNHQFLATIFFHHDYDFGGGQKSSIFGIVVYGRSLRGRPLITSAKN